MSACILVSQIMHMSSCRCGGYSGCNIICDYVPCMHACVAEYATTCVAHYATACMPVCPIVQCVHACMADCATACMPVWRVVQLHACLCGTYHY